MYKVRYAYLLTIVAALSACSGQPQTIKTDDMAASTPNEIAPAATESLTNVASTPRPTLAADEWKNLPIVPAISDTAREIYQRGLEMGNNPQAFSKVGDCQTSTDFFLVDFDHAGQYSLGDEYAELQSTIETESACFALKPYRCGTAALDSLTAQTDPRRTVLQAEDYWQLHCRFLCADR